MFNFSGGTNIGTASARVEVDLSQPRQAVGQMRTIAQQITDSLNSINRGSTTSAPAANRFGIITDLNRQMQEEARAAQRLAQQRQKMIEDSRPKSVPELDSYLAQERTFRSRMQDEIRQTNAILSRARSELSAEQQRFNVASAQAPSGVDRRDALTSLASQRQRISEVQAEFARLKQTIAGLPPAEQIQYAPQLREIQQQAQLAARGIDQTSNAINRFSSNVQASRSGVQGYFTQVRENLERINETSLAANLQEISFRLLPLGLAMGALARRGIETAESFQEINLSFSAFTGSEQAATQLMEQLTQQAHRFGLPMVQTLEVMQRFAPLIRQAGLSLDDTINIAARLATLNPAQGIEGALYAINEALAGQWRSLQFRFNIPTENLRNLIQEQGFIGGLDTFLNQLGRTTEFAEKFGTTARAAFTRLSDSISRFLAVAVEPTLNFFAGIAESVTNFFNAVAQGAPLLANLSGTLLIVGAGGSALLILLGQLALAWNAITAVLTPFTGAVAINTRIMQANAAAMYENATAAMTWAEAQGRATAAAAGGAGGGGVLGTLASGAGSLIQFVKAFVIPAVIGSVIGAGISQHLLQNQSIAGAVGATPDYQRRIWEDPFGTLWDNLKKLILSGISVIIEPFFVGKELISRSINNITDALDLVGTLIASTITDVVNRLKQGIADIDIAGNKPFANLFGDLNSAWQQQDSRFVITRPDGSQITSPQPGLQQGDLQKNLQKTILEGLAPGSDVSFIEGYNERIRRLLDNLTGGFSGFVDGVVEQAHQAVLKLIEDAYPNTAPGGGLTTGSGGTTGLGEDELSQAYELLVNNMIQTTRRAADEAIAREREIEDFIINRTRAFEDFNRQQGQALDDYQRDRSGRIDDFNRQLQESEDQAREQRKKNQEDYDKEDARRQQDHLRDMIRAARDVDDAISGRNFLAAQQALQKIHDAEEDYRTDRDRRLEDYKQQQKDLEDNLKEQQDKRQEDFQRQLRQADENFSRQQQRQAQEFALRISREDQDRALRQSREELDRYIRRQREQQDFDIRLASLVANNNTMQFIWQYGLGKLAEMTQNFWNNFDIGRNAANPPPSYVPDPGAYDFYGMTVNPINASQLGFDYGAGKYPTSFTGTPFANEGIVTRTGLALVHQKEVIFNPAGRSPLGSEWGGGGVVIQIDARGSSMSEKYFLDAAEERIVPKVTEALEKLRRRVG